MPVVAKGGSLDGGGPVHFRLLGPLEVETGGSLVRIAGAKERALLVLLLLRANRVVSRERLIDELWGERPPATARHTLEAYVSRLRRALGAGGGLIESGPGGYRIRVEDERLDTLRFERLLDEGRAALACGEPAEAEEKLSDALALWRGDALPDLALEPFVAGEAGRLEELRLAALEERAVAVLALGRHAQVVGELTSLVASHPLREGLRAQLMLALYRCGRQADALEAYRDGRRRLVEELGIEPGRDLHELQLAILRHDRALDLPTVVVEERARAVAAAAPPAGAETVERRKVVTVVSCEPSESTALAERLDPEALRALLTRYVERSRAIVERHGGRIETTIGDTVTALFGVPRAHEDDALRACRAAAELRDALPGLGLAARFGVATGEVVTASGERPVTGAAVALAGALARAAGPGEVLLGGETVRVLGPLVEVEPFALQPVVGEPEPGTAFRFLRPAAPAERARSPFVGRKQELALLDQTLRRAAAERELHLVTLLGPAGIGKSRLACEFVAALGSEVRVVRGRCLSYGEGISYWPLVEVLRALGEPARAALERVVAGGATSPQQLAWMVQRTLEQAAVEGPLVVVLDDLHWAEPALLDLLDAVCELSRGSAILLLCLARPELLEGRPGWAGGKLNAASVLLEPLAREECELIVDALGRPLESSERRRVVELAAGNPLFLEELTGFVAEAGASRVPPRIQALLQARLDLLPEPERLLLGCAAVEGTIFHREALEVLVAHACRVDVSAGLASLTRKELVRPVPAEPGREDGFRFRHQLIRDVAYGALAKADRAQLHERFAGWLDQQTDDRGELTDICAHHLERAALIRHELGDPEPALDGRAAERLAAAAERARLRTDLRAAATLWRRALALLDEDADRRVPELELELAWVLTDTGRLEEARRLLEHAERSTADPAVAALARLADLRTQLFLARAGTPAAVRRECAAAMPLFEQQGDHRALARAWSIRAWAEWDELQVQASARARKRAAEHAHLVGDRALEAHELGGRLIALAGSRLPYSTAADELERAAAEFPGEPYITSCLTGLRACAAIEAGRREEARVLAREALDEARRAGYTLVAAMNAAIFGQLELLAGDVDEAERLVVGSIEELRLLGERGFLSGAETILAEIRIVQGRLREAIERAEEARRTGGPDDRQTLGDAGAVLARAHARLGEVDEARAAAAAAVAVAGRTDSLQGRARAQHALAEALLAAGDLPDALAAAEEAHRLYATLERTLEGRQVAALAEQIRRGISRAVEPLSVT